MLGIRSHGRWSVSFIFLIAICMGTMPTHAQNMTPLAPTGLPQAASPEAQLPADAVIHVRVRSAKELIEGLDAMLVPFIPKKALPPGTEAALNQPLPTLAIIGALNGMPVVNLEMVSSMTGVDLDRPVTFSVYVSDGDNPVVFVASLPISDFGAASGIYMALRAQDIETVELANGSAISFWSGEMGEQLYLVASEQTLYVCNSPSLAEGLYAGAGVARLDAQPMMRAALTDYAQDHLFLAIDPATLKPMLAELKAEIAEFETIPDEAVNEARQALSNPQLLPVAMMTMPIFQQLGLRDWSEATGYAIAGGTVLYEQLLAVAFEQAQQFEGLAVSVRLSGELQSVRMMLRSPAIRADMMQPIPMRDVRPVLEQLPASAGITIHGRSVSADEIVEHFFVALAARAESYGLSPQPQARLRQVVDDLLIEQGVYTQSPWTVTVPGAKPLPNFEQYATLLDLYNGMDQMIRDQSDVLRVVPTAMSKTIDTYLPRLAEARSRKQAFMQSVLPIVEGAVAMAAAGMPPSPQAQQAREQAERFVAAIRDKAQNPMQMVRHDKSTHIVLHDAQNNSVERFSTLMPPKPMNPAMQRLLDQVTDNAVSVHALQILPMLQWAAMSSQTIEKIAHKELDDYLAKVRAIVDKSGLTEESYNAILEIVPPTSMKSLCRNPETGEFYIVTPLGLTYPRPLITPVVTAALAEFEKQNGAQRGGAVAFTSLRDGQLNLQFTQDTTGLAILVRTVGNHIVTKYVNDPAAQQELEALFYTPTDEAHFDDYRLVDNLMWSGPEEW